MSKIEQEISYTLNEIAEWDEQEKVSLPTVQRGFVWKPYQIENLWDSLLRGYPVGAFVLSPAENNSFHILDGQQRATAICLGFAKDTFRDSQDFYKVFIDLELPKADDSRRFVFRIITRSHPWGYRYKENNKTLTAENIRKALDLYADVNTLSEPLDYFFPYDAILPIPFYFFLNGALNKLSQKELFEIISKKFLHWKAVIEKWRTENSEELVGKTKDELQMEIEAKIGVIFDQVKIMLGKDTGQRIPALYMNLDRIIQNSASASENEEVEPADEVENLFVRLNSGGTQLSGEELNYSILKAHLSREVQDEIEKACKELFKPARFITIAYRLFQHENKEAQADALTMRIKPKQFQRTISKQVKDFEKFVLDFIRNEEFDGSTLLVYTQKILAYEKEKLSYGLPFLIYSKIADSAPELIFLLLYRIKLKGDRFLTKSKEQENLHRKMLGMITLFMWFGKGINLKDYSKLLANIWPAATSLNLERFWSSETMERANLNEVLLPFPSFKRNTTIDGILNGNLTEKTNVLNKFDEEHQPFLKKVIYNRDLLLFAQRHFIEKYFKPKDYRLEDTSLPFDWDHISPNKLVQNRKKIPRIAKDWYQTNGNFRAWPYALNRMDSDKCPAFKLNPLETLEVDDNRYAELNVKWEKFISNHPDLIMETRQIRKKLAEWSFCKQEWTKCSVENMRNDWKDVTKLIISRNFFLIQEWYKELNIEELRDEKKVNFEDVLDRRKWIELPLDKKKDDPKFEELYIEEYITWMSSPFNIGNANLRFYFVYPNGESGHLEENGIEFGLFEEEGNNYISKMKDEPDLNIDLDCFKWIDQSFTLVSGHVNSYTELTIGIIEWIKKLPVGRDRELLLGQFKKLFSSKIKAIQK